MAAKYDIKKEPQHIQQFAEYKQSLGKDWNTTTKASEYGDPDASYFHNVLGNDRQKHNEIRMWVRKMAQKNTMANLRAMKPEYVSYEREQARIWAKNKRQQEMDDIFNE
jgi:hypothetical protein